MRLIIILFLGMILFQINVLAELSSSSCALLRTATSFTTIIPEIIQLAMRYYHLSSSSSTIHNRQKRFLFNESPSKTSDSSNIKGTFTEQTIANTIRDVNFTNVALLIINNNDTMNKIRKHIDSDEIIRLIVREIDYEKLLNSLAVIAESEFDLEHFIGSIINKTQIDVIHNEILINGTIPEWLLQHLYPGLDNQMIGKIFVTLKNITEKFVKVLSKSERFDNYLLNMIKQQALTPLDNIIQGVKDEKPKTFDQLIEIIVKKINTVAMEQLSINSKRPTTKISGKKSSTPTVTTVDLNDSEQIKLMLYQWSIAISSMGQTVRIMLKSLDQLYCASVWE